MTEGHHAIGPQQHDLLFTMETRGQTTQTHKENLKHNIHTDGRKEADTQRKDRQGQHAHKMRERETPGEANE